MNDAICGDMLARARAVAVGFVQQKTAANVIAIVAKGKQARLGRGGGLERLTEVLGDEVGHR